jgi:hypothetical protein
MNIGDSLKDNFSWIPLWDMVNHEYSIPVGNLVFVQDVLYPGYTTHRAFFCWALAKTILWGEVPSVFMLFPDEMDYDPSLIGFLNSSLTTREFLSDFLVFGNLVDVPRLSDSKITIVSGPPANSGDIMPYTGQPYPSFSDDKIQSSLWENDKGQFSLVIANIGNSSESVNVESLASKYNLTYSLTDGGQYKSLEKANEENLTIKPLELVALVSKNNDDIVNVELHSNGRIDVGKQGVNWTARYAFDGKPFQGQVNLNSSLISESVGKVVYNVSKIIDEKYGFTRFDSNVVSAVYDRVKVVSGGTWNETATVRNPVMVWFKARYEYDNSSFDGSSGALYVNGLPMSWSDSGQRWERVFNSSAPEKLTFKVTRVDDNRFGLSTLNDQTSPVSTEWVANVKPIAKVETNPLTTAMAFLLIILILGMVFLIARKKPRSIEI